MVKTLEEFAGTRLCGKILNSIEVYAYTSIVSDTLVLILQAAQVLNLNPS